MNRFSLTHLSDEVLRKELSKKAANENEATAELLAHMVEFDERKLYLPAAYPSMFAYCVGELGLSEDAAKKRIQVARAGRACPAVFAALAEGRVHLTGLRLLAPHLTPENADELLAAATHKSMDEIERLLAERHPRLDVPAQVVAVPAASNEGAPGHLPVANAVSEGAARHPHARVVPLSPEAFAVQFTRSREADERFRYAQDLLGHQASRADIAEVYDRAIKLLVEKLERTRLGVCKTSRKARQTRSGSRHIPNAVKRVVWKRDGGQCTYRSESGRRCEARADLQFDHAKEFARGGEAAVDNLRLRCPGHNQHAAEQTYGAGFMQQKREEAAVARAAARAVKDREKAEKAAARERARLQPHQLEVIPWLEQLGCRKDQSRVAVERCRDMAGATLEDRVRRALGWFGDRVGRTVSPVARAEAPQPTGAPA